MINENTCGRFVKFRAPFVPHKFPSLSVGMINLEEKSIFIIKKKLKKV